MSAVRVARIRWYLRQLLADLGWTWPLAFLLLIAAVFFQWQIVMPLERSRAELQRDTQRLRDGVAARRAAQATDDPARQMVEFYRFFPTEAIVPDTLESLFAAASQENIVLEQGEYRLSLDPALNLFRYDIVLPVRGSYPRLRNFIARALKENKSLCLEGVSFNRQKSMDIGVEAQLRMTLYLATNGARM